jgi:hypothetical protein
MGNVFRPEPKPDASEDATGQSGDRRYAWQPITFRGVAAFAGASYPRLFWVQTFFAVLCAGTIVWALAHSWTPVIRSAVRSLPNEPPERAEQLVYPPSAPAVLAESRHLAVLLRPEGTAAAADVRLEFQSAALRVCSLFGCLLRAYPKGKTIQLTRSEAIPWWDAWEPILLGIVGVASALFFLALWTVLPTFVFLLIRLYAYFADRQLNLGGAWRLSAAAFLPGSLVLIAALVLYALGIADLIRFLIAIPGHLLIALIYLWFAPLRVERIPTVPPPAVNPFTEAHGPDKTSA